MIKIKINAYEYKELPENSKINVKIWLDEFPIECEYEDANGKIIQEYDYFSNMNDNEIQEHCEINEYLFSKNGDCIHHL
jgi:hypothetical protein